MRRTAASESSSKNPHPCVLSEGKQEKKGKKCRRLLWAFFFDWEQPFSDKGGADSHVKALTRHTSHSAVCTGSSPVCTSSSKTQWLIAVTQLSRIVTVLFPASVHISSLDLFFLIKAATQIPKWGNMDSQCFLVHLPNHGESLLISIPNILLASCQRGWEIRKKKTTRKRE